MTPAFLTTELAAANHGTVEAVPASRRIEAPER
jgi:hypothetical protein